MDAPFASQSLRFIEATLGKVLRAELLEELADDWECNAVTAYWSRSLLSGAAPPSASHGLVVSAIRHRWPKDWIRRYGGHSVQWCRGWGVDLSRQLIWRLDGRIVGLDDHVG